MEQFKTCRGCGKRKPLGDFAIKLKSRAAKCKPCLKEWAANYRETANERINANARAGYATDPTRKRNSKSAYYARNAEQINTRRRARFPEQYAADPAPWRAAKSRRKSRAKVRMTAADRAISIEYRRAIANDPCFYCGNPDPSERNVEHFFPLAKGGTDHWHNLVMSCGPCNRTKHTRCGTAFMLFCGNYDLAA